MKNIAVIGAGTMGNGIAHVFAQKGYGVTLVDIDKGALELALNQIAKNLERQVNKGTIDKELKINTLNQITTSTDLKSAVTIADLVIEAVSENLEVKTKIFKALDKWAPKSCILGSNTSSISITKIATVTDRPDKVIGIHFMNPVPIMPLVEVIQGYATSAATTSQIMEICATIEKTPVKVNDYPGFAANRILIPMINEAIICLHEGVAGVAEIDEIMKLGMAHPMGPLQLADFIGLDVCLSILQVLYEGFGQDKYAPCPLLVNMVNAGKKGLKTGEGFYTYTAGAKEKKVAERFNKS